MTLPADLLRALQIAAAHLPGDIIAAYVDDALTTEERQVADRHLARCPVCREDLSMLVAAVAADIANPARIETLVERLAAAKVPTSTRPLRARTIPHGVDDVIARSIERTRDWVGGLSTWTLRPAAEGAPMLATASRGVGRYDGVETPLETVFADEILNKELSWAEGALSLVAAYDDAGRITDLRVAVGCRQLSAAASSIVVRVGRQGSAGVTLNLTQDRPAAVVDEVSLEGPLADMTVSVSVGRQN